MFLKHWIADVADFLRVLLSYSIFASFLQHQYASSIFFNNIKLCGIN
jgi:hypothetical protein